MARRSSTALTAIASVVGLVGASLMSIPAAAAPVIETVKVAVGDDPTWASPDLNDLDWREIPAREIDPQGRLIWVRAHITIANTGPLTERPLAVYVSALASYDVYWNGELIGSSGTPGADRSLEIPGKLDTFHYVPPRLLEDGDNVLALKMSSFHLRRTLFAPIHFLAIDEYGTLGAQRFRGRLLAVAAGGSLLLGAIYFAAMFVSDRKDYSSLLLSLLSLGVLTQLGMELTRSLASYDYPLHILRLELIHGAAIASGLILVAYVSTRYAKRNLHLLVGSAAAGMAAATIFLPGFDRKTAFAILSALLAVIVGTAIGARARIPGSLTTGIVSALIVGWFAIGPITFIDQPYYIAAAAFLIFLFAQQVITLRRAQTVQALAKLRSTRLELELLKRQIQPHFLMNALTAVSEWVESDPQTAVRMIEALADEFRALAKMSGQTLVSLQEELELCRRHLEAMSFMKGCSFALIVDAPRDAQLVPPAIFHTLLENALTHNRYDKGHVEFRLEIRQSEFGRQSYRLYSPQMERQRAGYTEGRGHAYIKARLQEAFGDDWSFRAGPIGTEWVDTVEIPLRCAS